MQYLIQNARVFDGKNAECQEGAQLLIEDGLIREVSRGRINAPQAHVIDAGGRTLMPGMIDAHCHAYTSDVSAHKIDTAGAPYRTAHAARMLAHALDCGFTSIRDIGGGDHSLARAIEDRLLRAPRFFYAGKILSMTGGHGDFRAASDSQHSEGYCTCGASNSLCVIADGVDACITAAREQLRRGAHCIKIMGSGGVASPTDPIWMNQYTEEEIRAIVNESTERRTYTSAHCHPASAIRRCVEFGVRCIEHGTLIDEATARFVAEKGAFVVPTMVIIFVLVELGRKLGFPPENQAKAQEAFRAALSGLEIMRRANVKLGFGTDLLGETYLQQCREFSLRSEVFTPLEILRQCTSNNAAILQLEGKLGCIAPEAYADLLIIDGDPLKDVGLLAAHGRHLRLIMRAGEILRNELH